MECYFSMRLSICQVYAWSEREREQRTEMIIAGTIWILKYVGTDRVRAWNQLTKTNEDEAIKLTRKCLISLFLYAFLCFKWSLGSVLAAQVADKTQTLFLMLMSS